MPDFTMKQTFPIASVIEAAQRKAALEQQARTEGNQSLLTGLQSIGKVGQDLVDKRLKVAQALALGQHLGMPDNISRNLEPAQVISAATVKNKIPDILQATLVANPKLAEDPSFVELLKSMVPAQPQAGTAPSATPAPASTPAPAPAAPTISAVPMSAPPIAPIPPTVATSTGTTTPPPSELVKNMFSKPITGATAVMAAKMAAANKPENVLQYKPGVGLIPVGTKQKGDQVITTQPGAHDANEYDKLETGVINRIVGIRGDKSLARTEEQRDASMQAYNTIAQIKSEHRLPNQLEYYDILGQMWKARTGASPTDQAIRDLDASTFKGDLGKAYQYFSGVAAPRTTEDVMNAIQKFADVSGKQADKLHSGYMQSHLVKPKNMSQADFDNIVKAHRGLSFEEGTQQYRTPAVSALTPDEQKFIADYEAKQKNKAKT